MKMQTANKLSKLMCVSHREQMEEKSYMFRKKTEEKTQEKAGTFILILFEQFYSDNCK